MPKANLNTIRAAKDKLIELIEQRLADIDDIENHITKHDNQEAALEELQSAIEGAWDDFESDYQDA